MAMMHNVLSRLNSPFFFGVTVLGVLSTINWGSTFFIEPEFRVEIKDVTVAKLSENKTLKWDECDLRFTMEADLTGVFNWNVKLIFVYLELEYESPEAKNRMIFWDKIIWRDQGSKVNLSLKNERGKYLLRTKTHDAFGKRAKVSMKIDVVPVYGMQYTLSSEPFYFQFPFNKVP